MPTPSPIPPRKKLIEVALPLGAINEESARRKRKSPGGYPTTLHKWWAQRPLAACRAVLFASFVDDPSSDPQFRKPDGTIDEERAAEKRARLFDLIEQLVKWENSTEPKVIDAARAEIARCIAGRKIELGALKKETVVFGDASLIGKPHTKGPMPGERETATAYEVQLMRARPDAVNSFLLQHGPPVLDPFAGGGSIPLEAQRLGLRSYASDLNPVPVLITKGLIELPVSFASRAPINPDFRKENGAASLQQWRGAAGLAEDVRFYGKAVRDQVQAKVARLFPNVTVTAAHAKERPDLKPLVGQSFPVVAWLWARTVPSPDPSVEGAEVPLVRSFSLSAKGDRRAWVQPRIDKAKHQYTFDVGVGTPPSGFDPSKGTVSKKRLNGGRCLLTDAPMDFPYIRRQAKAGKMGTRLMAMAIDAGKGRGYLPPVDSQSEAARQAKPEWRPDCEFPKKHRNFQPPVYGLDNLGDIFTDRQLVVLDALAQAIGGIRSRIESDARAANIQDASAYAVAVVTYLAFALSRAADYNSTLSSWRPKDNAMRSTLAKQALPMVWDFAEGHD